MLIKLLSYNIRFGGRGREKQIAEVIRGNDPDLVVFQEAIHPHVIEQLATATSLPIWAARRRHSIGYISRLPVTHHEWHYPTGAKHSFLEIVLQGSESRIFGLHLSARFSKWSERQRAREIQSLLKSIERYQEGFHALVGDFNTLAPGEILDSRRMPTWIKALIWISGRDIQRETIRVIADAKYSDGYRMLNPKEKGYTFPTWDPHLRLDYVFIPEKFNERLRSCEVVNSVDAARASDHFPLLAEIEM